MHNTETPELVEAFLLIEQPRQRLGHWMQALAALDSPFAPALAAIDAFYDPTCDQALIAVRYDELALGPKHLAFVIEVALLAEVGMIQPAELSEYERKRFLTERLARCTLSVTAQRGAVSALSELVRKIKDQRPKPPPVPGAARTVQPRGDTHDPVLLVAARGTRDDLQHAPVIAKLARSTRDDLNAARDRAELIAARDRDGAARDRDGDGTASMRGPAARREEVVPASSRHVIARSVRLETVEMAQERVLQLATETRADPDPREPSARQSAVSATIQARYLRSGRWVPLRIGALSLKGAALIAGALPRLHDLVDVALSFGVQRALVRGAVAKVSSVREATSTGAATFTVTFDLDGPSRRQLTSLLTAARAANVTITPPPPRAARRFPVEWPVRLATSRGAIQAAALDVATGGMFVRPGVTLAGDDRLDFSLVLDDDASAIYGRARQARQITEAEGKSTGLSVGYGLHIVAMEEADRMRWLGFLARIERRADKRLLIGASPARLAELQAGLAACGYAVTGGTDPGALVQLANADPRPVDAALIDAGWLSSTVTSSWIESLFSARNVPFVTLQGDVRRARMAMDRLLEVVV